MFPEGIEETAERKVTRIIEGKNGINMTVVSFETNNARKRYQRKYKQKRLLSFLKESTEGELLLIVKAEDFNKIGVSNSEKKKIKNMKSYVKI